MPKLKTALFSFRADGRLGKALTYAHTKQGTIVKRRPTHVDAQTIAQLVQRQAFDDCRVWWHTLTPAEKEVYRLKDPRLGGPAGYLNFMRECLLGLVPMTISKIIDTDGDTWVDVEKTADEDIIRMAVKSIEAFLLSDLGILTLTKQSRCSAHLVGNQTLKSGVTTKLALTVESYDEQGEYNPRVLVGTADATEANKLHDADGGFVAADVGAEIWNTTDNTYATVTAFVDSGELTLDADIMVNGEGYRLYHARFTAIEAGTYLVVLMVMATEANGAFELDAIIFRNGGWLKENRAHTANINSYVGIMIPEPLVLAANDYLEFYARHYKGIDYAMFGGTGQRTRVTIEKIS